MLLNVLRVKQEIEGKDVEAANRQRTIGKLAAINSTLINTIESLELHPANDEGLSEAMLCCREDLLPLVGHPERKKFAKLGVNDVHSINTRLKQLLVILSREYFKSGKEVKVAITNYEEMRTELKHVELQNRSLQHDLDEIRKDEQVNSNKRVLARQLFTGVGYSVIDGRSTTNEVGWPVLFL